MVVVDSEIMGLGLGLTLLYSKPKIISRRAGLKGGSGR